MGRAPRGHTQKETPSPANDPADRSPRVSIIIPTRDEAIAIPGLLADLALLPLSAVEVIVTDGGSRDETCAIAEHAGARVVRSPEGSAGRGRQLRQGAAASSGEVLCFLHADVRLDGAARQALSGVMETGAWERAVHVFRLRIDGLGVSYRIIEWGANLRTRLLSLPYGDQGLIVSRADYEAVGGFPDVPLMEDVMLARLLGRRRPIHRLKAALTVSARRWERDGPWRRSARNLMVLGRFLAGVPPERLVGIYEKGGERRRS